MLNRLFAWRHRFTLNHASSGFVAWLFGVSGPLLIVLNAAAQGDLPESIVTSWVFAIYVTGGVFTMILSQYYRKPIAFAHSIPGAVLVGTTLANHSIETVVGAYIVTALLIFLVGITGAADRVMKLIPLPIMMGMVSGVLLPFGLGIVTSVKADPVLNGLPLIAFLALAAFGAVAKRVPPIVAAIAVSAIVMYFMDIGPTRAVSLEIAVPVWISPEFDLGVIGELVIPLAITVIGIQNAQGIGVLRNTGYVPPVKAMTIWSGIGSLVNGVMGGHSACIAGPMTAIIADKENGKLEYRYYGAMVMGILWIIFGVFAPTMVQLAGAIPASLIQLLGGLAMIGVLMQSMQTSFSSTHKMGALFAFLITLSNISIFQIGAPFWGLLGGMLVSWVLDQADWRKKPT